MVELKNLPVILQDEGTKKFIQRLLLEIKQMVEEKKVYKWVNEPEYLGIGISGFDAYDYSGSLEKFDDIHEIEDMTFHQVYTGKSKPSFESHQGLYFETYNDFIIEQIYSYFLENCPLSLYLDEEKEIENDDFFDWVLEHEYACSNYIEDNFDFSNIEIDF